MSYQDMESGGLLGSADAFSDAAIRRGFIRNFVRKVYGIPSVQLLVTVIAAGFFFIPSVQGYASQNPWLLAFGFIPVFVCMIVFACCDQVRRKSPGNYICLAIFTLAEGNSIVLIFTDFVNFAIFTKKTKRKKLVFFKVKIFHFSRIVDGIRHFRLSSK